MKICNKHGAKLWTAIEARDLDHLVAKTLEERASRVAASLKNEPHPYDPLLDCNTMILTEALARAGGYMLFPKQDGSEYCPICAAVDRRTDGVTVEDIERGWIDGPADATLSYAREHKLVPDVQ